MPSNNSKISNICIDIRMIKLLYLVFPPNSITISIKTTLFYLRFGDFIYSEWENMAGSIQPTSQRWPSKSWKLRPYIQS